MTLDVMRSSRAAWLLCICPTCHAAPGMVCNHGRTHAAREQLAADIDKGEELRRHRNGDEALYRRYERGLRLRR